MLKIDSHMIAMQNCEHWKTGELKELIDSNPGINTIQLHEPEAELTNREFEDSLNGWGPAGHNLHGIKIKI